MNIFEVRTKIGPREARSAGPSETSVERERVFLVRAKSGASAVKHVAAKFVHQKAQVAPNVRVAELMTAGVRVEEAKADDVVAP